jgi:hypothetical protein
MTNQDLENNVKNICDEITNLDTYDKVLDYLANDVLEITHSSKMFSNGNTMVSDVELLRTYGGPTIVVRLLPDTSRFVVEGRWGSDVATAQGEQSVSLSLWCLQYCHTASV